MSKLITTPAGIAVFAHLTEPNTRFNPDGCFDCTLRLPAEESYNLIKQIKDESSPLLDEVIYLNKLDKKKIKMATDPWIKSTDIDGNEIPGHFDFKFKQNKVCGSIDRRWTFAPKLFDQAGQPWDITKLIGFGSKVRVAFRPNAWFAKGEVGCSLKLASVQVLVLKTPLEKAEDFGFTTEPYEVISGNDIDMPMPEADFMKSLMTK